MAFIRPKVKKGKTYFYLVENKRVDGKVKQKVLKSLGRYPVVPTDKTAGVGKSGAPQIRNSNYTNTSKYKPKDYFNNLQKLREERNLDVKDISPVANVGYWDWKHFEEYVKDPEQAKKSQFAMAEIAMLISRGKAKASVAEAMNWDKTIADKYKQNQDNIIKFFQATPDFASLCKVMSKYKKGELSTKVESVRALQSIDYKKISDLELMKKLKELREFYKIGIKEVADLIYYRGGWEHSHWTANTRWYAYKRLEDLYEHKIKEYFDKQGNLIPKKKKYKSDWDKRYFEDQAREYKSFVEANRIIFSRIQKKGAEVVKKEPIRWFSNLPKEFRKQRKSKVTKNKSSI